MKNYLLLLSILITLLSCKKIPVESTPKKNFNFDKAESLFENEKKDSAYYYFNLVVTKGTKDSLTVAMSYYYMANIQAGAGDYFGAQESAMRGLKFTSDKNKKDYDCLAAIYNLLSTTSTDLKQYSLALSYSNLALKFSEDDEYKLRIQNNQALAYQKLKQYPQSLKIYNQVIKRKNKNSIEYARVLSNIAKTKWLQNPNYNAASELLQALSIREKEKDDWGKNASYSHLADYYTKKLADSAFIYALKMYQVAKTLNSAEDQLEALQKLITLSPSASTKQYFSVYQLLADSVQTERSAAKNQFAIIRYESEKSKADNLKLQQENTEKQYKIVKREVLLASGFLLFLAASIIAILWYKKRQQKMELEKESAIQENHLRTSKKVHDVVANGLYRVMSEMENQPDIDRELIIDKIEDLYEKSRDISYDKPELNQLPFQQQLLNLLSAFSTAEIKVLIVGNTDKIWENVSEKDRYELEQILQELMVNMKKHSYATTVVMKFELMKDHILITYSDDGVGMPKEMIFNNGLRNTGNRIDGIGGTLTFENKQERGLKIQIIVPIS